MPNPDDAEVKSAGLIAGSAVIIASKLAQDTGDYGMIQVSDVVLRRASAEKERPTRTIHVSGIDLKAYDL